MAHPWPSPPELRRPVTAPRWSAPPEPHALGAQALSEYSAARTPRMIDGIMLTKFDTISDKVGAALSLVYTTGKPIVFVGVGQTYNDIRNLNVDHCVKALLR